MKPKPYAAIAVALLASSCSTLAPGAASSSSARSAVDTAAPGAREASQLEPGSPFVFEVRRALCDEALEGCDLVIYLDYVRKIRLTAPGEELLAKKFEPPLRVPVKDEGSGLRYFEALDLGIAPGVLRKATFLQIYGRTLEPNR